MTSVKLEDIQKMNYLKSGNFRLFMLEMGRCSGGLIGDDPFIFYKNMTIRGHILTQDGLREDLLDILSKASIPSHQYYNGTFLIAVESETQFFYLNTKGDNPERVFHFDDNTEIIYDTGQDFLEYMINTVRNYEECYSGLICTGELLNIVDFFPN